MRDIMMAIAKNDGFMNRVFPYLPEHSPYLESYTINDDELKDMGKYEEFEDINEWKREPDINDYVSYRNEGVTERLGNQENLGKFWWLIFGR
jgi:hypothetical protein